MLTVHQLASVVAADLTPETTHHEVRRARRFAYHGQIRISHGAESGAEAEEVSVVDLSARGLRFTYTRQLARGTTFVARLPRCEDPELVVLCTVAHAQSRPNGLFTIGVEFTCVMSEAHEPDAEMKARISQAILSPPNS